MSSDYKAGCIFNSVTHLPNWKLIFNQTGDNILPLVSTELSTTSSKNFTEDCFYVF